MGQRAIRSHHYGSSVERANVPERPQRFIQMNADHDKPRGQAGRVHSLFAGCASLWLAAALIAAVARAIEPFAHGIWLVAYLFLVGFLAQVLLARGQATVLAAAPSDAGDPPIGAQVALWNAGVVAVPLGVLVEARVFVVVGSVALLSALAAFWRAASRGAGVGYLTLMVFMAASVLIGTALAWDTPWL
jgi:hypothetical protein